MCAIINVYSQRSTSDVHGGGDIANQMLEQLTEHNIVEKRLSELG